MRVILTRLLQKLIDELKTPKTNPLKASLWENLSRLLNLKVKDFLIPRNQIKALELSLSWEEMIKFLAQNPHSFYPVYKGTLDHYLGYVSLKDLVKGLEKREFDWQEILSPPLTLPENLDMFSALQKMQEKEVLLAFVVDEHSELIGIFNLYEFMEEAFSLTKNHFKVDPEGWITLPASTKLYKIERHLRLKLPEGYYETIAGYILYHLQRIPKEGEKFILPPFEIEIIQAEAQKIEKVRIRKVT